MPVTLTVAVTIYHGAVFLNAWSIIAVKFMVTVGMAAMVILHCGTLAVTLTVGENLTM